MKTEEGTLSETFEIGETVQLDKGFANSSMVKVLDQTSKKLYTTVTDGFDIWVVMTYRLTKD